MSYVFLICAAVGGTVMVLQFVLTLIGFGGEAFDLDVDADMDADAEIDFDTDTELDAEHVGSTWMFGVLSFRTILAAMAFFGLAGLACNSAQMPLGKTLLVALAAGAAAMFAVYWMMRGMKSLKAEGTARIERTVGRHATVYTTIPAEESGSGKIQINLQNRTMEYSALTSGRELSPGTKVVVVDIITSDTVEVEPVLDERNDDV